MTKKENITADEFVDLIDELCFKYKYELTPKYNGVDLYIEVNGEHDGINVRYIDGDGRGK